MIIFAFVMKKLCLFNPENDMALASGSPYYMAPASAKKMAADLSVLPVWYEDSGCDILLADARQIAWLEKECRISLPMKGVVEISQDYDQISPWGWNPALLRRLRETGVAGSAMLSDEEMLRRRMLSGRQTAVALLPRIRKEGMIGESFWMTGMDEVNEFVGRYNRVLLKAPWSGSGKGIQWLSGGMDDNVSGWVRRILAAQGGIVGEPGYEKVLDFAMEFKASRCGFSFVGYSLFQADARGIYKENRLASDETIEEHLSTYVAKDVLETVRVSLLQELPSFVGGIYQGYLGVDMMVVRMGESYAVHPCVEVNLRTNMGIVARKFYDHYVCKGSCGRYVIEYYPKPGEALLADEAMRKEKPLCLEGKRIRKGYFSLTPVFEDTTYQIYVEIKSE